MKQILTSTKVPINQFLLSLFCAGKGYFNTFFLLSLVLLTTFINVATAAPDNKAEQAPQVSIVTVTEQNVNPLTEYVAHLEAVQSVDLQARVSGFLEQVNFKEGSQIKAGDLLYVIEPAPYRMKVAMNRARVAKAEATLRQANQHLGRIKSVRSGGVPVTDLEAAEAAALQALADLQEAEAELKLAEIDLEYTRISAPISGRIGATALTQGNLCGPTSGTLARIVQLDPIRVLFSISENDFNAIKAARKDAIGQKSGGVMSPRVQMPDGRVLENSGRIDFVDNQVDPSTGTIAVRALFENPDGLLLPGQYVTLLASQTETRLLPIIPQAAVLEDRDGRYVLLVNDQNQVEQRRIKTGATVNSMWAVEKGLAAGERLIVEGLQKVRPGQVVKTVTAEPGPGK